MEYTPLSDQEFTKIMSDHLESEAKMITHESHRMAGKIYYEVPIPGTTVTAYLATRDDDGTVWTYGLWTGEDDNDLVAASTLTLPVEAVGKVTADQVARIAFLLDVEYA